MEKTMDSELAPLFSPNEVFFFLNCIIILLSYYSTFWSVIQLFIKLLLCMWRVWAQRNSSRAEFPANKPCIDGNIDDKLAQEAEMPTLSTVEVLSRKPCLDDDDDDEITIGELITVMGKLGTSYDPNRDELQERLSSQDIAALFEEQEPSLQELKQAFAMFDENNDGFIDAKEIRKVLCALCLTGASEADCKGMIRAFDDNGDGVIDFNEFVRTVATSFS